MPEQPTEFFSSFEPGDPAPGTGDRLRVHVGDGPAEAPAAKPKTGFSGLHALNYRTGVSGQARTGLFRTDLAVTERSELSYVVFPEADPAWRGTFVAIDIEFDDGTTLASLNALDQHGFVVTAKAQGLAKKLYLDQWNHVRCSLAAAAGKRAKAILLTTEVPEGDGEVSGWLDDVRIAEREPTGPVEPVDRVRTTRGTHSANNRSRGNNIPATALPHGFNFWTPVTDAGSTTWVYEYHRRNNGANRPALEAFGLSHQPSPWMGDRHTFQVMPRIGELTVDRQARALAFDHANELDRPYHYRVRFDNGITGEIAPADHAAMLRFTFPAGEAHLIFDNADNRGGLRLHADGTVTGHTWVRSRLSVGARRMYVYGKLDRAAKAAKKVRNPLWRAVTGHLSFDVGEQESVTLRIATSLISLRQAQHNLELEIPDGTTFDAVRDHAREEWRKILGRFEIEGASEDQLTTFYSNLYRLYLYPNSAHENTGTTAAPVYRHASPVSRSTRVSTGRRTGAKVLDGPMVVNNGFWDTYRTTWPAYALFSPERCGQLAEGFVQQYREGGWISRWSSPGYANLMTGTSSDVAFADAYLKGVHNFDVVAAYDAALKNATVTPPNKSVGRKGLDESIFLGYTPASTPEGLSWALEGCINDFGIANLSRALHETAAEDDPRRAEYLDNARYFTSRALHYVHHFDKRIGFFQGRDAAGGWRWAPEQYDPAVWGFDYTETNGWNMAFTVPHDGGGLAYLFGGRKKLESTLDTFFATPETGLKPSSYGGIIHEMTEARDIRLGQYGHSNQPSHHIPWMYLHAGAPAKAQAVVREVLLRCYLGSELGQGYPGDEDNGEMSAWYLFAALGFYPLAMGSPSYVLGAPLFTKATVHLENGEDLVINAPGNTAATKYVRGLKVNGEPYPKTHIPHATLAQGAVLDFDLAEEPGDWGTGEDDLPPSLTTGDLPAAPLTDLPGQGRSPDNDVSQLFDDTSRTQVNFGTATPTVEFTVDGAPRPVSLYTLTSALGEGDPSSWVLEGSDDGEAWRTLDERQGQVFRWRRQTRPFSLAEPAAHRHYRLRITGGTDRRISLAQWELLGSTTA
ncbi:GH92 family glycosyl hydrolase [Amycolatopsis magusensis]|uniref:GH92 family glycosyl hydrolase n=1 Tax=Amycolatopsis magusensis TaxID=882444 RepID=UPI00378C712B